MLIKVSPKCGHNIEAVFIRFLFAVSLKALQEGKIAVLRTTAVMTPVTQVLVPTRVTTPGTLQMAKIAPATTALPTQQTTVLPVSTLTGGVPGTQPALTTKTILPQTTLQQVQTRNVVINPAGNIQQLQRTAEGGETIQFIQSVISYMAEKSFNE